jgi:predicted permease
VGKRILENLGGDLRFAVRTLRKSPVFVIVAVACIALGSGAVTTIYSTMNALVLRPLPGTTDGDRLVRIERKLPGSDDGVSVSYPFYEQLRDRSRTLDGLIAWGKVSLTLRSGGEAGTVVYGNPVSGNLFSVLGVRPALGRFFTPEEDRTELTDAVIVVSEGFWRSQLGADSSAIGRDIMVNGRPFTLIGVAPRDFQGLDAPIKTDAWVPLHMQPALRSIAGRLDEPSTLWLRLGGRLKDGVSVDVAHQQLSTLAAGLEAGSTEPSWLRKYTDLRLTALTGLPPDASGKLAGFLGLLLGAAGLVLIIASVNVAALLSARAMARRREMAVRAALGAARGRLVTQLLTETLLLFALGAAGGAVVALGATRALERIPIPAELPFSLDLAPDPRVLAFALAVSLLTGAVVGLAPARYSTRTDLAARLRDGSLASAPRRTLAGSALVVGQLAVSLLLLVGAGLFVRALQRAGHIDLGFERAGVATVALDTDAWGYDQARGSRFYRALTDQVSAIPGVTAVSYTTILPLNLHSSGDQIQLDGSAPSDRGGGVPIQQILVAPGYFSVLRIPLVAGRTIDAHDDESSARTAVINETMAKRFWPDGSALGRSFGYHGERVTIVGIARDAKYASLSEPTPTLAYFPLAQSWRAKRTLMVRTATDIRTLVAALPAAMRAADTEAPRPVVATLEEATGIALLPQRVAAMVTGVLGVTGLILSMTGLYGVISYAASRRSNEIGIRMALGARRADVLGMIVGEGMRLTVVGIVAGLLLAAAATRLMVGLLFGVSPLDAGTYVVMPALLVAVALLASYLPARRAADADPSRVLRAE